jgi:hypothetical protein
MIVLTLILGLMNIVLSIVTVRLAKRLLQYSDALEETQLRVFETYEFLEEMTSDKELSSTSEEVVQAHKKLRFLVKQLETAVASKDQRAAEKKRQAQKPVLV